MFLRSTTTLVKNAFGGVSGSPLQQPVDPAADVLFPRFAGNARDHLAGLIEDECAGYNVAKAYTNQLGVGFAYPELDDVIGITICNFELWPRKQAPHVPMLSRWRMQEQESGVKGLPHLQFVFLELPKYAAGHDPTDGEQRCLIVLADRSRPRTPT